MFFVSSEGFVFYMNNVGRKITYAYNRTGQFNLFIHNGLRFGSFISDSFVLHGYITFQHT